MVPILPSDAFPRTDALLAEWAVLREACDVTLDLGEALKAAFAADSLMDTHSDRTVSVEKSIQMLSPNATTKIRELRGWFEDAKEHEIKTVPGTIPAPDLYATLAHLRKGYELLAYFTELVRLSNRKFPEPYLRRLELLVLSTHKVSR